MGNSCCVKTEDLKPTANAEQKKSGMLSVKSPISKQLNSKSTEVNPFKPGNRQVRIVQTEDGKLEKTIYKPNSNGNEEVGEV